MILLISSFDFTKPNDMFWYDVGDYRLSSSEGNQPYFFTLITMIPFNCTYIVVILIYLPFNNYIIFDATEDGVKKCEEKANIKNVAILAENLRQKHKT